MLDSLGKRTGHRPDGCQPNVLTPIADAIDDNGPYAMPPPSSDERSERVDPDRLPPVPVPEQFGERRKRCLAADEQRRRQPNA